MWCPTLSGLFAAGHFVALQAFEPLNVTLVVVVEGAGPKCLCRSNRHACFIRVDHKKVRRLNALVF